MRTCSAHVSLLFGTDRSCKGYFCTERSRMREQSLPGRFQQRAKSGLGTSGWRGEKTRPRAHGGRKSVFYSILLSMLVFVFLFRVGDTDTQHTHTHTHTHTQQTTTVTRNYPVRVVWLCTLEATRYGMHQRRESRASEKPSAHFLCAGSASGFS